MSLKLRELIKQVRACKTAEEERSLVNKETSDIRNLSRVKILLYLGSNRSNKS